MILCSIGQPNLYKAECAFEIILLAMHSKQQFQTMKNLKEVVSPISLPEISQNFLKRRKETMSRIKTSLQSIPLLSQNRTKATSRLSSQPDDSDEHESNLSSSTISDHHPFEDFLVDVFDENYEVLEKLGEGSSGVVHRCVRRATDEEFAVKSFMFEDEHVPGLKANFLTLKRLQHPYILKYQGLYLDLKKHSGHLVMELAQAPSLSKAHLTQEADISRVMHQILMALAYLHKQDVVHRDIKPENVLYDPVLKTIKLIDFGISRRFRRKGVFSQMWTITGTLYYRAPEMFSGGYGQAVDVWAAGVLLYRLVCGRTPFESEYHHETIRNIREAPLLFSPVFDHYSNDLRLLICQMLQRNTQIRPDVGACLKNIWFYECHTHLRPHIGSLRDITDETCEKMDESESDFRSYYEPIVGSLKYIEEPETNHGEMAKSKPASINSFQPFFRKSTEDDFYVIESESAETHDGHGLTKRKTLGYY